MLSVPVATASAGWIGVFLLCFCAFLTWCSANLLGRVMLMSESEGKVIRDYASVGEFALGRFGRYIAAFGQYSLLM